VSSIVIFAIWGEFDTIKKNYWGDLHCFGVAFSTL
jgi:hypothetical protein